MKRGFKTWAEKTAISYRRKLGLKNFDPLPALSLATFLKISIITPDRIPGITSSMIIHLLEVDPESWSAITLIVENQITIVHNSAHSKVRQETNLMHEIAHTICEHKPCAFHKLNGLPFSIRTCDKEQEEEADWLGGCLKIPRDALLWALRKGMDDEEITNHFTASRPLVRFRRNMTGVNVQINRMRSYYR